MKFLFIILSLIISLDVYAQEEIENIPIDSSTVDQIEIDSTDEGFKVVLSDAELEEKRRREAYIADLDAQGAWDEFFILDNKDTLVVTRTNGDWAFGFMSSINNSLFGGNLRNLQIPWDATIPDNTPVTYQTSTSTQVSIGLSAVYQPVFQDWGLQFRLFYDPNSLIGEYTPPGFDHENVFQIDTRVNYWGFTASYSRRIPSFWFVPSGLQAFAGLEGYLVSSSVSQINDVFMNTSEIQVERTLQLDIQPLYGLNIGVLYNANIGDFYRRMRMYFTPFAMVHINSSMIGDYNSNLQNYKLRLGLSLTLGLDKQQYDTLKYDPTYNKGASLAVLEKDQGVEFTGFYTNQGIEAKVIEVKELASADVGVSEEPQLRPPDVATSGKVSAELKPEEKKVEALEVKGLGLIQTITFSSSRSSSLSDSDEAYLDRLVEFLKENPTAEIRIEGHADNTGSPQEQNRIADRRAKRVQAYLVRKGISRNRVLEGSFGARQPVRGVNPNSDEGRRKSRRVEIKVVKM